jgi:hypothetical protein
VLDKNRLDILLRQDRELRRGVAKGGVLHHAPDATTDLVSIGWRLRGAIHIPRETL